MFEIVPVQRKSPVLVASKLPCLTGMRTLNLTSGCAHGCLYCYAQGYAAYPGRGRVFVYANLLERLRDELGRARRRPEVVSFSPASDLFQPVPEVLSLAYDILNYLLTQGIGVVFLTKGRIPKQHMQLLLAHASQVRAQIGLIAMDPRLTRRIEPHAASPRRRLEQMRVLTAGGIATQARFDPMLPGVTDDPDTLHALCAAVADAGVRQIAASTLFLRQPAVSVLRRELRGSPVLRRLIGAFDHGRWLSILGGQSTVLVPSTARRKKTYQWLLDIARQYGLEVRVCGCKNPDLSDDTCNIAGRWSPPVTVERQLALFAP